MTDQSGEAVIKLLPGIYDVLIEADGFAPLTIQNNQVYIANATELGDVGFGRSAVASLEFVEDRAILMAIMANIAYAKAAGWGDLRAMKPGDKLSDFLTVVDADESQEAL